MGQKKYLPTGNEMVSIPEICEHDASIKGITFLHMGFKGMIELQGADEERPFLKPFVLIDGKEYPLQDIQWRRINYWIPEFTGTCGELKITGTILAPVSERGFVYNLKAENCSEVGKKLTLGLKGCWSKSIHEINESKEINTKKSFYHSKWNSSFVFDLSNGVNMFSFAPIFEKALEVSCQGDEMDNITFNMYENVELKSNSEYTVNFYWGIGFEEVGAVTAAQEMLRKGYQRELQNTCNWLSSRIRRCSNLRMQEIMNLNLFFNFFFASGITLDTEEFVLVTSRSSRYYVSAAYWDRDSLLWSFPSILLVDQDYAKEMIDYVFKKQIRNVGIHSRYIDGTVLEPGFELDELCAPVIALYSYVHATGQYHIVNEPHIEKGIDRILKILETKKDNESGLYETFLQPTDDPIEHPYLTYDNVLVWKMLSSLAQMYQGIKENEYVTLLKDKADSLKRAIWNRCVVEYQDRNIFAWSIDLKGKWNIYDEPPGSLQLLSYYGFCDQDNEVYKNTVEIIRDPSYKYSFSVCNIAEIGCEHAPHPWVLSIANSLLCGRKDHCKDILDKTDMDNGIACESVDENTGECTTGEAFATCAGFLAYAIYYAFGNKE